MSIHQAPLPLCQRANALLLIIDAQERLAAAMPPDELAPAVANVNRLLSAATILDIPVITTQHYSKGLGPTLESIRSHLPEKVDTTEKTAFSCCTAPGFESAISAHPGRRQVVLVGMEAHICVLQTASGLQRWGYQVFVPEDAIVSRQQSSKLNALKRMRHCGIHVVTSESVGFEWVGDSADHHFRDILAIFK